MFVGLGNPGEKYVRTRHNIGFIVLDKMASDNKLVFTLKDDLFWYCEYEISGVRTVLLKPKTYMNLSGLAVQDALEYFGMEISHLMIIYDDIHLPFGKLRLRAKGSDGGHKGISSIIYHLHTINIPRLRIGIGNNLAEEQLVDYVLSPFNVQEEERLPEIIELAAKASNMFVVDGIAQAMNCCNSIQASFLE